MTVFKTVLLTRALNTHRYREWHQKEKSPKYQGNMPAEKIEDHFDDVAKNYKE